VDEVRAAAFGGRRRVCTRHALHSLRRISRRRRSGRVLASAGHRRTGERLGDNAVTQLAYDPRPTIGPAFRPVRVASALGLSPSARASEPSVDI
jgi:hypothetical protein